MADLGGAVTAFSLELAIKASVNAIRNAVKFKSSAHSLETRIRSISNNTHQIDAHNQKLKRPLEETQMLAKHVEKGQKLLGKCKKIKWWNYFCLKPYYARQISEFQDHDSCFLQTDFQIQQMRDEKEVLVEVKEIKEKLDSIIYLICNQNESVMSETLKAEEVKLQPPGKKVEGLVMSASPCGGEASLATEFSCHKEIQGLPAANSSLLEEINNICKAGANLVHQLKAAVKREAEKNPGTKMKKLNLVKKEKIE